jgi:flagellar secretion chaperone FliS
MNPVTALNTYKNVGLESGVAAADPHKLILMLYQGALLAIASAKNQMLRNQIAEKGNSVTKAIKIIDEGLKACLDVEAGGDIGKNLLDLYDYMTQRLFIANLKNDITMLDEVSGLLNELKEAWESIKPAASQATPAEDLLANIPLNKTQAKSDLQPPSAIGKQAVLLYGRV